MTLVYEIHGRFHLRYSGYACSRYEFPRFRAVEKLASTRSSASTFPCMYVVPLHLGVLCEIQIIITNARRDLVRSHICSTGGCPRPFIVGILAYRWDLGCCVAFIYGQEKNSLVHSDML